MLDIGAGPGGIASELVKKGCRVAVVDQFLPTHDVDSDVVVFTQDLDEEPTFDVRGYDYLLLLDVIEHLKNPERFLERLRAQFDYAPRTLILTTPNIAFGIQRLMLLFGQFNYGKAGILDRTHTRLFTFRSLRQLLDDAGFRIKEIRGVPAPFPKVLGDGLLGKCGDGGQPAADPRQPVAVLVSDLRDRRGDAGRRLHPGGRQAPRRALPPECGGARWSANHQLYCARRRIRRGVAQLERPRSQSRPRRRVQLPQDRERVREPLPHGHVHSDVAVRREPGERARDLLLVRESRTIDVPRAPAAVQTDGQHADRHQERCGQEPCRRVRPHRAPLGPVARKSTANQASSTTEIHVPLW